MFCLLSGDDSVDLVTTNINLHPGLHSCSVEQNVKVSHSFIQVQLLNMLIFTQKGCRKGSDGSSTVRKSHRRRKEDFIKRWQMSGSERQMWQMCRGDGHHLYSLSQTPWKVTATPKTLSGCAALCSALLPCRTKFYRQQHFSVTSTSRLNALFARTSWAEAGHLITTACPLHSVLSSLVGI